jgi:formamidopyrimidine-DNA glycosylase
MKHRIAEKINEKVSNHKTTIPAYVQKPLSSIVCKKRTKQKCLKKGCGGVIVRKVIGGRSAHFCPKHQK